MKTSRRLIRNTILALGGAMVLYVGVNRLYAVDEAAKPFKGTTVSELAMLRDFSRVVLSGDLSVEVVQQPEFSITYTPEGVQTQFVASKRDDALVLHGVDHSPATQVKIGMPSLASLTASEVPAVTISGFEGARVSLRLHGSQQVKLRNNSVRLWQVSGSEGSVSFDRASLDAGKLEIAGRISVSVE